MFVNATRADERILCIEMNTPRSNWSLLVTRELNCVIATRQFTSRPAPPAPFSFSANLDDGLWTDYESPPQLRVHVYSLPILLPSIYPLHRVPMARASK